MRLQNAVFSRARPFPLLVALALALLAWAPASAQGGSWQVVYWSNTMLSGEPALVRSEGEINHDWGTGSPHPAVPADRFSARWTGAFNLPAGRYRFTVTTDDGARLWVGDRLLIDRWTVQPASTFDAEFTHGGGDLQVRLEYFENTDVAVIRLSWTRLEGASGGVWRGEYFNNEALSSGPALVRDDAEIAFNWGGSPAPGVIEADHFSARWTRNLDLPAGNYRFTVRVDDGARLWVNNALIIDEWRLQPATTFSADIYLPGGETPIRLEYFENVGGALVELWWAALDGSPPPTTPGEGAPVNVWRGEYFNNVDLSGAVDFMRNDAEINFHWAWDSPVPGVIGTDRFSVRWLRTLSLSPGRYRFSVLVDDGARLWVDGRLVIDDWQVHSARSLEAVVDVRGGATPVVLHYFEDRGEAVIQLSWAQVDGETPPPATGVSTATVVGARYLNVRSGPGVQYGRVALLEGGQRVEVVRRDPASGWVQIRLSDGRTGWVNGRYLS